MDQVDEVKRKSDIVSLVSEYVELKKAGRNYKGLCPFHSEKSPSFIVSPEIGIFKCFGCSRGGDVYNFLMELEKIEFPQALKILADRAGVKLAPTKGFAVYQEKEDIYKVNYTTSEFYHYLLTTHEMGQKGLMYLKNRGITDEAIKTFKLGVCPNGYDSTFRFLSQKRKISPELLEKAAIVSKKNNQFYDRFRGRLMFPLFDHYGNIVGFAGRVIDQKGETAKYINSPETLVYKKGNLLYGLETTKNDIKKAGFAVVVEGEIDCISSWQAGVKNVVAIKGSAFTPEQATLISRFCSQVVLALDADFAGSQAARRGLQVLQEAGVEVKVASLGDYKDPDEMARADAAKYKKAIDNAQGMYDFLINVIFASHDSSTTEGKAKVSREIVPILAEIEDEIVRAYCIGQVATRLGVPEEAVAGQVGKIVNPRKVFITPQPVAAKKDRKQILEERLLTLAFQIKPEILKNSEIVDLFSSPIARRVLDEFNKFEYEGQFDPALFSKSLPEELVEFFSIFILSEIGDIDNLTKEKEIEEIHKELELIKSKEAIAHLITKIKESERMGDTEKLEYWENLLNKETAKLTQKNES